jgi:parallel beta-helix repeat protein
VHSGITIKNLRIDTVARQTNKRLYSSDFSNSACIVLQGTSNYSRYDDIKIFDNELSNCGGGGIKVRVGQLDNQGKNLRVHNNTILQVRGDGIVISYADSPLVDHNIASDLGYGTYAYSGGNFAGIRFSEATTQSCAITLCTARSCPRLTARRLTMIRAKLEHTPLSIITATTIQAVCF